MDAPWMILNHNVRNLTLLAKQLKHVYLSSKTCWKTSVCVLYIKKRRNYKISFVSFITILIETFLEGDPGVGGGGEKI